MIFILTEEAKNERREYMRRWREKNRLSVREYSRNWRRNNREAMNQYAKAWRDANPDRVKQYQDAYWERKSHGKDGAEWSWPQFGQSVQSALIVVEDNPKKSGFVLAKNAPCFPIV